MNTCQHEFVIKDGATDKHALKIPICSKCGHIGTVVMKGEEKVAEPQKKLPGTGEKITRMSVLKAATDIVIADTTQIKGDVVPTILNISEDLENWVNRAT